MFDRQALQAFTAIMRAYVNTTLAYGFTRSVTYDYQHETQYFNTNAVKFETKEMLLTDKVSRITGQSCLAIVGWPGMICEDLRRVECSIRGKDKNEYE